MIFLDLISMISGNYMGDLLTNVKLAAPEIPWTTRTPMSSASWEKIKLGSMTLITFYKTFFWPPLGLIVIEQLNLPTYSPINFTFSFFTSSGFNFSFSFIIIPFPYTWKTIGVLEVFFNSKNYSSWWPIQITGVWLKISHFTLNLGSIAR